RVRLSPAALIESTEGEMYSPLLDLIAATASWAETAKSYDRYPTVPFVWEMRAATPSLPLPADPTGQSTALSAPTFVSHSELSAESHDVKTFVVPDSSERCATMIVVSGSVTPAFCWAISGSFHFVTL